MWSYQYLKMETKTWEVLAVLSCAPRWNTYPFPSYLNTWIRINRSSILAKSCLTPPRNPLTLNTRHWNRWCETWAIRSRWSTSCSTLRFENGASSSSWLLSSLELRKKVFEPQIRARLGTAAHFCQVVVLELTTVCCGTTLVYFCVCGCSERYALAQCSRQAVTCLHFLWRNVFFN
jgi:hypothetical protein